MAGSLGSWDNRKTILLSLVSESKFLLSLLSRLRYTLMRQTWKDDKRKQLHHPSFPLLQFLGTRQSPDPLNVEFRAGVDLRFIFCYPIMMGT